MPGCIMGFIGSKSLLWNGMDVTFLAYVWKFAGTVIMAFGSGLATAYAAYLVEIYKKKKDGKRPEKKRQKGKAA